SDALHARHGVPGPRAPSYAGHHARAGDDLGRAGLRSPDPAFVPGSILGAVGGRRVGSRLPPASLGVCARDAGDDGPKAVVAILATLRQDRAGDWKSLDDYLRELRHRETGALAALAHSLSALP